MRILVCVFSLLFIVGVALAERPALTGRVVDSGENGIEGATVYIWEGRVKVGTSTYCPSCYPDCGKKATANADGTFTIESLDPELTFNVLAVAEGYQPTMLEKVDPADGDIMFVLGEIPEERLESRHRVDGRVVDPEGNPVMGAKVEIFGMEIPNGRRYGGMRDVGVDPLAVTNARGEFVVTSETPDVTFFGHVSARDFATQNVHTLSTGGNVHEIVMQRGVTVSGYVRDKGEGVAGVEVGMVPADRNSHTFTGDHSVGTFDNGYFEIPNLPAETEFNVYGIMQSLQGIGTIPTRNITTGPNGERFRMGDLTIEPGFSIKGRVELSDGGTIPADTRLSIAREDAWDSLFCVLAEDGSFFADGLPRGEYGIYVRVPGYRISKENYSLDPLNLNGLIGTIHTDIEDFTLLLEPGERWDPNADRIEDGPSQTQLQQSPIRGVDLD